jgi:hypothetical protein
MIRCQAEHGGSGREAAVAQRERDSSDGDEALERMKDVVERYCARARETWDLPADPMRDLHAAESVSALAWTCLPDCPPDAKKAARAVESAAKRRGVGPGPFEPPEGCDADELAARRRRRPG